MGVGGNTASPSTERGGDPEHASCPGTPVKQIRASEIRGYHDFERFILERHLCSK